MFIRRDIKYRNISRREADGAWDVRIMREGETIFRRFLDGKHGGKEKGLEAAILYRDTMYKRLGLNKFGPWASQGED
jgi:hypothetical protein